MNFIFIFLQRNGHSFEHIFRYLVIFEMKKTVGEKFIEREAANAAKLAAQKAGLAEQHEIEVANKKREEKAIKAENRKLEQIFEKLTKESSAGEYDVNNTTLPHSCLDKEIDNLADKTEAINFDAANYEVFYYFTYVVVYLLLNIFVPQRKLKNTCIFHTCGICGLEFGLENLSLLDDPKVAPRIAMSSLKDRYLETMALIDDPSVTQQKKGWARAMRTEMLDGLLRDAKYACDVCISQLPKLLPAKKKKITKKKVVDENPVIDETPVFRCAPDNGQPVDLRKIVDMQVKWSNLHQDDFERGVTYHNSKEREARVELLSDELALLTLLEHHIFFARKEYWERQQVAAAAAAVATQSDSVAHTNGQIS